MILLKSTDKIDTIQPKDGFAWHYLWELVEFGVFKNGYAKHTYKSGKHGGYERVRWCLHDVEKAFDIDHGTLTARIHRMKMGENDRVLSAEQFVHARNAEDKIYTNDKRWLKVGGKSEFYSCSAKTAFARFANSYRKCNLELGNVVMWQKRHKGQYGVPSTCGLYS
jgi:hypothetical protein